MSQVIRKYQNSGKIEQSKPETFERRGVGKYNKADLVAGLYKNIPTYIQNNGLSGDKADAFRESANQFIKGIENGTITMDGDGTFTDSTGAMSSTGKFDKNWIGGSKNTSNNAFNLVGNYATDFINQLPQYTEPKPVAKGRFNAEKELRKEISKRWYGGNEIDPEDFYRRRSEQDRTTLLADIANNMQFDDFDTYDWSGTGINSREDIINKYKQFGTAISDNTLDNVDYNSFASLGITGLDKYLKEPEQEKTADNQSDDERLREQFTAQAKAEGYTGDGITAYVNNAMLGISKKNEAMVAAGKTAQTRSNTEKYFEQYKKDNPFKSSISGSYFKNKSTLNADALNDYLMNKGNDDEYFSNVLGRSAFTSTGGQNVVNNIDYLMQVNPDALPDLGDGYRAVPTTYDYDKYSAIAYNPSTKQYKDVSMLDNPILKELAFAHYENPSKPPKTKAKGSYFQQGGIIGNEGTAKFYQQRQAKKQEKANTEKEEASRSALPKEARGLKQSEEQKKNNARNPGTVGDDTFTWADYTRLGAIGADLISMIPGAGVVGFGGSVANFAADMEDGIDWGDAGRLGGNLMLDIVGLVPGLGIAAKGSKTLKQLIKWAPRILAGLTAANYAGPAYNSFKKLTSGEKLTVDDYRNMAEGVKIIVGGGRGVKRQIQAKGIKNAAKTGNTVVRDIRGEEYKLTPEQLSEVTSHKKLGDQQAALQLITKDDGLTINKQLNRQFRNPSTWLGNSRVRDDYDFNQTKTVQTATGPREVPLIYSTAEKQIARAMQTGMPHIPGVDSAINTYNKVKYRNLGKPPKDKYTFRKFGEDTVDAIENALEGYDNMINGAGKGISKGYKKVKEWITPKKEYGGTLVPKYQSGKVMNRDTSVSPNPYLSVTNNAANAANPGTWDSYYDMNKMVSNMGTNSPFANKNASDVATTLNSLGTAKLPWEKKVNATGYKSWNTQFDSLGLNNDYFGRDANKFDYMGPTTWNRKALLTGAQGKYNSPESSIPTKDGNIYYDGKQWTPGLTEVPLSADLEAGLKVTKPKGYTGDITKDVTGKTLKATPGVQEPSKGSKVTGGAQTKSKLNLGVNPADVLALGRMVGGLSTNNRAAQVYKEGLKPTLLDTFENTVPLQGNFQAKSMAEQQAGNLESTMAQPRTSDASLQLAGQLEGSSRAGQLRQQGDMADAERFYQTRMMGQQESDAAKARRVQTANQNRGSMNAIDAAKKQIDSARITANYQQVLAPYLGGVENQFRQNEATKRQFAMEQAQNTMSSEYDTQYANLMNKYKDDAEGFGRASKQLRNKAIQDMNNFKGQLFGNPWLINNVNMPTSKIPYAASGSKLTARERAMLQSSKDFNKRLSDDNKLAHKDIMEAKREHNKLIANMSSLTAALIKKGMNL